MCIMYCTACIIYYQLYTWQTIYDVCMCTHTRARAHTHTHTHTRTHTHVHANRRGRSSSGPSARGNRPFLPPKVSPLFLCMRAACDTPSARYPHIPHTFDIFHTYHLPHILHISRLPHVPQTLFQPSSQSLIPRPYTRDLHVTLHLTFHASIATATDANACMV